MSTTVKKYSKEHLQQIVADWAKEFKKTPKEIWATIVENTAIQKARNPTLKGDGLTRTVLTKSYAKLKNIRISGGNLTGIIAGQSGQKDWLEIKKQQTERIFKNDPDKALAEGLVNEAGQALDQREKVLVKGGGWTDNPYYLSPIELLSAAEHLTQTERTIEVLVEEKDPEEKLPYILKLCHVKATKDKAVGLKVPIGNEVEFAAGLKKDSTDVYYLNSDKFTPTDTEVNVEEAISSQSIKTLDEAEGIDKEFVLVEATIFDLTVGTKTTRLIIGEFDGNYQINVTLPVDIDITCGKDSRVIVGGYKTVNTNEETNEVTHRISGTIFIPRAAETFPIGDVPKITPEALQNSEESKPEVVEAPTEEPAVESKEVATTSDDEEALAGLLSN